MTSSRLLFAAASLLLLSAGTARAQVVDSTQTKPELNSLPPDRPVLSPTPPPPRPTAPTPRPVEPTPPVQPPTNPGTFTPARPPQPNALPNPATRPAPENVGTVKPEAPTSELLAPGKWFILGNPDLGFRSADNYSVFHIGASAMLGYRLTDRFAIGPGLIYQYYSYSNGSAKFSFSNVGARVFGQALITDNIFIHAEHEILRTPYVDAAGFLYPDRRTSLNSTFLGVGYRQHLGSRAALDFMGLLNLSYETNFYVYGQPEIRFNLLFDLF